MDDRIDDDGDERAGSTRPASLTRRSGGRTRSGRRCPRELAFIFANPPLAPGESEADWTSLCDGLADGLQPRTVVDWLRLRDVASGVWESLRLERYRDALLRLERGRAATDLLSSLLAERIEDSTNRERAARSIARGWLAGRSAEKREMAQALASAGIDEQSVAAGAFVSQLETHERLERLRRRAEEVRDSALATFSGAGPLPVEHEDIVIEAEVLAAPPKSRRSRPMAASARTAAGESVDGPAEARTTGRDSDRQTAPPDPQPDLFG